MAINQWAMAPGGFPPQLIGRVSPAVWQQFITEISAAYMRVPRYQSEKMAGRAALGQALLQLEQVFGPQLGAAIIGNGEYRYEAWHDGGEDDPARWEVRTKHFLRLEWPMPPMPMGGIVVGQPPMTVQNTMQAGVQMAAITALPQPVQQAAPAGEVTKV